MSVEGGTVDYTATSQRSRRIQPSPLEPELELGLEVSIEELSGGPLGNATVETVQPFDGIDGSTFPRTGSLVLTDGEARVMLDADGGDANAFVLTVEENGTATAFTVPWSDAFRFGLVDGDWPGFSF